MNAIQCPSDTKGIFMRGLNRILQKLSHVNYDKKLFCIAIHKPIVESLQFIVNA